MEYLIEKYSLLLRSIPTDFIRSLYEKIDWDSRGIMISGARGTGKSTLMLQRIKIALSIESSLYLSLDDLYFREHTLTSVAESFIQQGGQYLFLDEVHKYPNWQQEVKNLYDFHPRLQLILSGSSILALQDSQVDLSRRVLTYELPELSFREFLALQYDIVMPSITLEDMLTDPIHAADLVLSKTNTPLKYFAEYLQMGAYPFFLESRKSYNMRIQQLINLIVDYDLPSARQVEVATQQKLKQLLYILSTAVPFKPNIAKLARQLQSVRVRVLEMLDILEKAQLIHMLRSQTMGSSLLNKPDKLYLHNPNLIFALAEGKPNIGNLRETFLLSQLRNAGHNVTYPKAGDFKIDNHYTLEVGGKDKTSQQIQHLDNAFIAADNTEYPVGRKIPLWLFGMLY